jgi:energy-coupling factor transporter ATP-binding protein EcfA2
MKTDVKVVNESLPGVALTFGRGARRFGLRELSDGERQVLYVAVLFLLASRGARTLFLIDEPELHLHEARCIELWEALENRFAECVFVYLTHSVAFATRTSVDRSFVLDIVGSVQELPLHEAISPIVMRDIVGTRIQLLRTDKPPLFCEDNLQRIILTDLFGDQAESVVVSNSKQVIAAASREEGWKKVRSGGGVYGGVVDRDMRDEEEAAELEGRGVFVTPFYDAESFILVPELISPYISQLANRAINLCDVGQWICDAAKGRATIVTLKRLASYVSNRYGEVLEYKPGVAAANIEDSIFVTQNEKMRDIFITRAKLIQRAIESGSAKLVLKSVICKSGLYSEFRKICRTRSGIELLSDPAQQYRAMKVTNDEFIKVSEINEFRQKTLSHIGLAV